MPFLFLILFILFFGFILIFIVLRFVLRGVFSILNPRNYFRSNKQKYQQETDYYSSSRQQHISKKIFEKNEGEYVDYEEVK